MIQWHLVLSQCFAAIMTIWIQNIFISPLSSHLEFCPCKLFVCFLSLWIYLARICHTSRTIYLLVQTNATWIGMKKWAKKKHIIAWRNSNQKKKKKKARQCVQIFPKEWGEKIVLKWITNPFCIRLTYLQTDPCYLENV